MANVDTGLGWSAAQNFLVQSPHFYMGELPGSGSGGLPIMPEYNLGMASHLARDTRSSNYYDYYGGATGPAYIVGITGSSSAFFRAFRADTTTQVFVRRYDKNGASSGSYDPASWSSVPDYAGLQVAACFSINNNYLTNVDVPVYSSEADAAAAVAELFQTQAFYKLGAGYAVACFATWNDLGGVEVTAPVLISSVDEATYLSLNNVTPAPTITTLGVRWQGMTFKMALLTGYSGVPSDASVMVEDFTTAFPGNINVSQLFEAIARISNLTVLSAPDPYGDDAEPGGGEGNPDEEEDVDFSGTPSVGTALGFFRMWNPSEAELRSLASWMWSSAFDLDTFKRIFSAPIDAILGLSLVPVQPSVIGGFTIVLGGIDTEIAAYTVTNRYVTLDCGSLNVAERWGAYLDYAPYTKMSIFLPYIGFRDISTDDVMDKTVALQYNVDVLSGACVAELKCGGTVLYSWQGNCAQQLPITSQDWSSALSAALGLAGSAAAAIVSGGSSLPLAGTVASATVNALSLKPRMERGGSISGAAGAMAGQVPYLVRERPEQAVPGRQNHFIGYPSFTTVTLGSIAGYTEVESIHLEGIPATAAELDELENILKEGFIL